MENKIGIVIIGRNEGKRFQLCLRSVMTQAGRIVYVDSGSTDSSVNFAKIQQCDVLMLDTTIPFSAARARNEGFSYLVDKYDDISYVQFIDGDCELLPDWLEQGGGYLNENLSCAVVAGHTKERFPENSIYNRLCDIEWYTPNGDVKSCGGIFMVRAEAFHKIGGFLPTVMAGEEPELCYRLRNAGWKIFHFDQDMVLHDADIKKFSQWWQRAVRSGLAYAQGVALHGNGKERYCLRETLRIWFWALLFPVSLLFAAVLFSPLFLLLLIVYLLQIVKIMLSVIHRVSSWKHSLLYSVFVILGKWPQLSGQILFVARKWLRKQSIIVEYK